MYSAMWVACTFGIEELGNKDNKKQLKIEYRQSYSCTLAKKRTIEKYLLHTYFFFIVTLKKLTQNKPFFRIYSNKKFKRLIRKRRVIAVKK